MSYRRVHTHACTHSLDKPPESSLVPTARPFERQIAPQHKRRVGSPLNRATRLDREKVEQLRGALNRDDARVEAANILRGLIEEIRLTPEDGKLRVHLVGLYAVSAYETELGW